MRTLLFLPLTVLLLCPSGLRSEDKHYLYVSTPDAAQMNSSGGTGILVFDLDDGHRLVRRIQVPEFKEGLRGFCGSLKNRAAYYTTTSHRLGRFDLETEKVLWEQKYEAGCDRACVTPDGKRLYVPTGWWWRGTNSGFLVADAQTGQFLRWLPVGPQAHNSIASADGQYVYLGTETNLTVFRAKDNSVVWNIAGVGESGVFPFTVDSRNRHAYICLGSHVGFDVVDLSTGRSTHRILAGELPITHRTHGAGLTPDETELWISDQDGKKLFIFDATQMPPTPKGHVDLSSGGHGWICFSLDGRFAWCHTPDVIDVKTRKVVATLKDENGKPFSGSKFFEVDFRNGKVLRVGDQFGVGRAYGAAKKAAR